MEILKKHIKFKTFRPFGYPKCETRKPYFAMRQLLVNCRSYYLKTRHAHWDITRQYFYGIYNVLEGDYHNIKASIAITTVRLKTFDSNLVRL